jgi:hypothetical protein
MTHTKDEALKLALEAQQYAIACLTNQLSTKDKHAYAVEKLDASITAIKQARSAPVPLTEMAKILVDRLVEEQAVYLSMETAKSFVKSMLVHGITEKGQP